MENPVLSSLLSALYGLRVRYFIAENLQLEATPSPDIRLTVNGVWDTLSSLLHLANMNQPPARASKLKKSDESWDVISDLKHFFDIPHINVLNANTKRNPTAKNNPDLVDYIIVSGNPSVPKKKKKIEVGYEVITQKRVEASARKEFEKSEAAGRLTLCRDGVLGPISEDRIRLLEKEASAVERLAREEREEAEFVMVEPEDYIYEIDDRLN